MEKLISYICGDIHMLKHDMSLVGKALRGQRIFNKSVAVFALACGAYTLCDLQLHKKHIEKIESLTKEVEELNKLKGE